jgi:hypothetical protein
VPAEHVGGAGTESEDSAQPVHHTEVLEWASQAPWVVDEI